MPPVLLMFAARYWRAFALALALSAALVYRAALVHERDAARRNLAELRLEADELKRANSSLSDAIARQDAAVGALKARADAAAKAAEARERAAQAGAAQAKARADQLAAQLLRANISPLPPAEGQGEADCEAAIRWGNARAAELSRW